MTLQERIAQRAKEAAEKNASGNETKVEVQEVSSLKESSKSGTRALVFL